MVTALVTLKSARRGVMPADAELSVVSGSNWSARLTRATLVTAFGLVTVAWMVRMADAPFARLPTVHSPVAPA